MQEYNNIDHQMHGLAELIAMTNRNYVPEKADDSHTNLYFDALGNRLMGRWFGESSHEIMLCFNLNNGHLEWLDKQLQVISSLSVAGQTLDQLYSGMKKFIVSQGFEASAYNKPMHYKIPDYDLSVLLHEQYKPAMLISWSAVRALANEACNLFTGYLQVSDYPRIWPHHFDTGIYMQVKDQLGIGFGLAMKDAMVGDAYFYMSGYSAEKQFDYQQADALSKGYWIKTGGWKGAVLPLAALEYPADENRLLIIGRFIQQAAHWFLSHST